MARWHDRPPAACAPRHRGTGLGPGWPAQDRAAGASLPDRALSALHPSDPGEVPDPDRQPAVRDGVRTRLPRQRRSLPPPHRLLSAALGGGSLSTSAHPARRPGATRLPPFSSSPPPPPPPPLHALPH